MVRIYSFLVILSRRSLKEYDMLSAETFGIRLWRKKMKKIQWKIGVSALDGSRIVHEAVTEAQEHGRLKLGANVFDFDFDGQAEEGFCSIHAGSSDLAQGRFFIAAELPDYRDDWFIMIPSACYDGNRFQLRKITKYPPMFLRDVVPDDPMDPGVIMKEIPSLGNDFNRMITDASAPLAGVYMPERREAFFLQLEQDTVLGNNGIELEITPDAALRILISMPCVRRREFTSYVHLDTAPELKTGQTAELHFQTRFLPAADLRAFYRCFAEIRNMFPVQGPRRNRRSFSHTEEIIRKMFEEVRWIEKCRFYTNARGQERASFGWVAYPELAALFHEGTPEARKHVLDQLDNFFSHAPLPSGFFLTYSTVENGQAVWQTKCDGRIRQQCEILFYSLRLFRLFELEQVPFPAGWRESIRKLADALKGLWEKYHQFGFLLDLNEGTILVGGSFFAALAPAALVFAADYFREPAFLRTAEESARCFCEELGKRGFTYGGVGDALFTPDSESGFSLLESLVLLYEQTRDREWLEQAEFCADYCSSWVPAVSWKFPEGSTFDMLGIDCRGAVQANLQNQHGAPGPCIGSANALFRLYRYTGKCRYLEMLADIAHNCVQYLSTENHPLPIKRNGTFVPPGDICEKVFFQDHGNSAGCIPFGSGGWTEIAVLLCVTENPGVYYDFARQKLLVLDHVEASLSRSRSRLTLTNPFDYPIAVRLWDESGKKCFAGPVFLPSLEYETVKLAAHETICIAEGEFQ